MTSRFRCSVWRRLRRKCTFGHPVGAHRIQWGVFWRNKTCRFPPGHPANLAFEACCRRRHWAVDYCNFFYHFYHILTSEISSGGKHWTQNQSLLPSSICGPPLAILVKSNKYTPQNTYFWTGKYIQVPGRRKGDVHWTKATMSTSGWLCKNSRTASMEAASGPANCGERANTSAPSPVAQVAMLGWSVDTHKLSNCPYLSMAPKAHSSKGRSPKGAKFLSGIPCDPPRAKIRPATCGGDVMSRTPLATNYWPFLSGMAASYSPALSSCAAFSSGLLAMWWKQSPNRGQRGRCCNANNNKQIKDGQNKAREIMLQSWRRWTVIMVQLFSLSLPLLPKLSPVKTNKAWAHTVAAAAMASTTQREKANAEEIVFMKANFCQLIEFLLKKVCGQKFYHM